MPIAVKDYSWEQTDESVFITVPLKGVVPHKVDILSADTYIKVNYPPYIFECFLFAPVHDGTSAVQIGNGTAVFKLKKVSQVLWESLQCPDAADKTRQKELREFALERYRQGSEERKKKQEETKYQLNKYAVQQQMKLEQDDRKWIDDVKDSERKQAMEDLEKWKDQQRIMALQEKKQMLKEKHKPNENTTSSKALAKPTRTTDIFSDPAAGGDIAPLRATGKLDITFTPREFLRPKRESAAQEEEAYLAKMAEAQRIIASDDKDLSEEERNPVWLRDKGNSFFKVGDYPSAINAYSHAIRLNSQMPSLYSNRAACHLKLNNLFKCLEDSSKALELLTPPVQQNRDARIKAHIRRGTAFCKLEAYVEGLMDYEAALKLDPDNQELRIDADKMRLIVQGSKS